MIWTGVASGHEVTLRDSTVVVRNADGRELKSVPAALKDDPVVVGLRQLAEYLQRHEASCRAQVETWMLRSLPVPLAVITAVWPDPAWQGALRDLVVRPFGDADAQAGLLRDVDPARGLGVVTLDGDSLWIAPPRVAVPHPVLLGDLDELRGFVADLGVEQTVPQLFREVWTRPSEADLEATDVQEWVGGTFKELRHLTGRATSLGYSVRGGYAVLALVEDGRALTARFWVGSDDPSSPAETGDLGWVDERHRPLRLGDVGPVAWSEGTRMAVRIHAGRVVDEEAQQ